MYQELCQIISNEEVMPGVHLIWVYSPHLASSAQPGQFVMISSDSSFRRLLRRPISVHQVTPERIAFLFAIAGDGTEWLSRRQTGEKIDLLGPMGHGFSLAPNSHHLLLAAGGIGIAPLCFLAQEALRKQYKVTLLAGARTGSQIYPFRLIPHGAEIIVTTEDGTAGEKGLVTTLLARYAYVADQVFICGPLPMYKAIWQDDRQYLRQKPVQVSLEVRMGCGLGFCYACTIRTSQGLKQACKDGPVFDWEEVIWEEMR